MYRSFTDEACSAQLPMHLLNKPDRSRDPKLRKLGVKSSHFQVM